MPDRVIRCLAEVSIAPYPSEGLDWLDGMTQGNIDEFTAAMEGEAPMRAIAERFVAAFSWECHCQDGTTKISPCSQRNSLADTFVMPLPRKA